MILRGIVVVAVVITETIRTAAVVNVSCAFLAWEDQYLAIIASPRAFRLR
jgi:hypothetical protein